MAGNAQPTAAQQSTLDQIEATINQGARAFFFAAWPTATYQSMTIDFSRLKFYDDGADVPIQFRGTGVNNNLGTDLWLDVVTEWRHGQFVTLQLGENNGLVKPFATTGEAANILLQLLNGATSQPAATPAPAPPATPAAAMAPIRQIVPATSQAMRLMGDGSGVGPGVVSGTDLLAALDNSLWIADGAPNEKQVYVFSSPCDQFSRNFYTASRNLPATVQLRWFESLGPDMDSCKDFLGMVAEGDTGLLDVFYANGVRPAEPPADLTQNAFAWNMGTQNALQSILRYMVGGHPGSLLYPILVWESDRGIEALERPSDWSAVAATVIARPEAETISPMSRAVMGVHFELKPANKRAGAKTDGVKLYVLPDERAQVCCTVPKDYGYPIAAKTKVNGETWFELQTAPNPSLPNWYVRQADVVQVK